ncbi:hypothetical protein [Actinokineospora sp. HUAS TT18]|uniref:hypothetical protein n=1 Tax=Actinokineospora sp. HUAS TT18 TaxID=3447451 RepID=UPI003F526683
MIALDGEMSKNDSGNLTPVVAVILDWFDGPVEGILQFVEDGSCWHFKLFAERVSSDDLDDRVFALSRVDADQLKAVLAEFDEGQTPLVWPFGSGERSAAAKVSVKRVIASAESPILLVRSQNLSRVDAFWWMVPAAGEATTS